MDWRLTKRENTFLYSSTCALVKALVSGACSPTRGWPCVARIVNDHIAFDETHY